MAASGSGVVDIFFTATPSEEGGINIAIAGIDATTRAEAWFQHGDVDAHGTNTADEHEEAAALCTLACQVSTNNLNIKATAVGALATLFFQVHYFWSTP